MSRTSGARFPDPPEGEEETKRYRVTIVLTQELDFEVSAFDEESAEEVARDAYRVGDSPTCTHTRYIEDIEVLELES